MAWAPQAWQGKRLGASPRGPFLGAPGPIFQSEKYCEKDLQGGGWAQAWGADREEGGGP